MRNDDRARIAFLCTGIDGHRGGIETFFAECFQALRPCGEVDIRLYRGSGSQMEGEYSLPCLARNGNWAPRLGSLVHRSAYTIEQISAFPAFCTHVLRWRPHVIFYSDANHGFQLHRWRRQLGVDFRLLFSNGGPCEPPFDRMDFVQQVAPLYYDRALSAGEPRERQFMVPYGIATPANPPNTSESEKQQLRVKLGLPADRPIVLSVGWISRTHKRMDYVVDEIASVRPVPPFLAMIGREDASTKEIIDLATKKLGRDGFMAVSVPYGAVAEYYQAAEVFALGSLSEGFGRVFLEAMCHGTRCLVHDHPVMRFVLGDHAWYGDFEKPGTLRALIDRALADQDSPEERIARWEMVGKRFEWASLRGQYIDMFQQVASRAV